MFERGCDEDLRKKGYADEKLELKVERISILNQKINEIRKVVESIFISKMND